MLLVFLSKLNCFLLEESKKKKKKKNSNYFIPLQATERELNWILRISVVMITVLSTLIALTVDSVYYLS